MPFREMFATAGITGCQSLPAMALPVRNFSVLFLVFRWIYRNAGSASATTYIGLLFCSNFSRPDKRVRTCQAGLSVEARKGNRVRRLRDRMDKRKEDGRIMTRIGCPKSRRRSASSHRMDLIRHNFGHTAYCCPLHIPPSRQQVPVGHRGRVGSGRGSGALNCDNVARGGFLLIG